MNTPVSFELAKLLKEKGYKLDFGDNQKFYFPDTRELTENHRGNNYPAPTITQLVMWLYEKHGVWIMVKRVDYKTLVRWDIYVNNNYVQQNLMGYNSPTEAYEAAILYTLNKLI